MGHKILFKTINKLIKIVKQGKTLKNKVKEKKNQKKKKMIKN